MTTPQSGPATPPAPAQRPTRGWSGLVYAVGQLRPQFPSLGVEKEFAQVAGRPPGGEQADLSELRRVLNDRENLYLGRHLCWVLTALDAEVFTVAPRDDGDVVRLAEMLSPELPEDVLHIVVGRSAPGQTDTPCAVAGLPVIVADQLLAFTLDEFAAALPVPDGADAGAIREVFLRLTRRSDNRGTSDEHRALNYLAVRYPDFYRVVLDAHERGLVTAAIDARPVPWAQRRVVAVRLAFRNRSEIAERYQCSVDVSEVFPFIVSPLARYYE